MLALLTYFSNHTVHLFLLFNLSFRQIRRCLQHLYCCLHAFRDYAMQYIHVHSSCQLDEFSSGRVDKSSCLVQTASTTSQQECLHQDRPKFR